MNQRISGYEKIKNDIINRFNTVNNKLKEIDKNKDYSTYLYYKTELEGLGKLLSQLVKDEKRIQR